MAQKTLIAKVKLGFKKLKVSEKFKKNTLFFLKEWLGQKEFKDYRPQIEYFIEKKNWELLLDSFYQIIPFGTGGRRGPVGIGPNRINYWTIRTSAQGHSQYLFKKYGSEARRKGVVLAYDVRQYLKEDIYDKERPNPVANLNCRELALAAAEVYAANGIKVYLFDDIRSTPELSFAIRYLGAIGGDMFSASHNPPEDNGKKVYDLHGGQLIPPDDQELVDEVTNKVKSVKTINFEEGRKKGLIKIIGKLVDETYIKTTSKLSLSNQRNIKIVYTPFHGTGITTVYKVVKKLGFNILLDPKTSNPSGRFENITFNIPNPEVEESFDTPLRFAKKVNADLLLSSDPDADRIGLMVNLGRGKWRYLNGNEIGVILTEYVISSYKRTGKLSPNNLIIKTDVTTGLAQRIAEKNKVGCIGNLLVGFKYISEEMNKLEEKGKINDFLLGLEESHGYIAGNYVRDKDASIAAIWVSELAAELKQRGKTLLDFLNEIYAKYGCFRNYLTEIRLLGAEGRVKIDKIQNFLRHQPPKSFGKFKVIKVIDRWEGEPQPHLSETDTRSRDVLVFYFEPPRGVDQMKATVRPSGTEPKIKMYFEIGCPPFEIREIGKISEFTEKIRKELEKDFMKACYKILGVDFPNRGFLLFWQLPLEDKLRYFKIEKEIAELKNVVNKEKRVKKLEKMLAFLGSDPINKIDKAFQVKYKIPLKRYLNF